MRNKTGGLSLLPSFCCGISALAAAVRPADACSTSTAGADKVAEAGAGADGHDRLQEGKRVVGQGTVISTYKDAAGVRPPPS